MLKNLSAYNIFTPMLAVILLFSGCTTAAPTLNSADDVVIPEELSEIQDKIAVEAPIAMTVYKSPTCGCCGKWVEHMEEAGFEVTVDDFADMSMIKEQHGIQPDLQSCHTAIVGDYIIEGHVPADAIERLLAEQPDIAGLVVPGMPIGSPGMEVDGYEDAPFTVFAFDVDGETMPYTRYPE